MSLRQFAVSALALLGGAYAASSCCFVVQDEAHEIYWSEYATETYTTAVNLTSITTLLTPYPTTTVTNYETNIYLINRVLTTTFLVTENPVSLYTNPAHAIPQKTVILAGSEPMVTGGVTIASPTGFWVYSTAKVFAAPAVTDSNGNVACGTLSSFSNVAATAAACVPTFTGINGNAVANFDSNSGQEVEISLTTPFIHIPTRTGLQISPSEACVQGNGTQNYGYPVQQLIDHLAGNAFYSSQYPGIENCLPAGPTIQAVEALAVAVSSSNLGVDPPAASTSADPPAASASGDPSAATTSADLAPASAVPAPASSSASVGDGGTTETPGGGLTSSTTIIVTVTGPTSLTASSVTSNTAAAGSTSTTSSTSTSVPTALPVSTPSASPTTGGETAISGGLLPASSSSTSLSIISPLMETTAPVSNSTSLSISSQNSTTVSASSTSSPLSSNTTQAASSSVPSSITSALSSSSSEVPSTVEIILPSSVLVPENSNLPGLTGSVTTISSSPFVIIPNATTVPLVVATGLPAVTASSAKEYVSWRLLFSIMSLAAIGLW